MSLTRKSFNKNGSIDKNSTLSRPRHEHTSNVLTNSSEGSLSQEKSNFNPPDSLQESNTCLVTQLDQAPPITGIKARPSPVQPNAHVVDQPAPMPPGTQEMSASMQPSIRVDGRAAGPTHLVQSSTCFNKRTNGCVQSSSCVEEGSSRAHINRLEVSSEAGPSLQVYKISSLSKAGLNTQQFDGKKTSKTASHLVARKQNVPPSLKAKDSFSRTVITPSVRMCTPAPGTKPATAKSKPRFMPPVVVKPQLNSSTIMSSSPPPSNRQIPPYDRMFKSPTLQNSTAVDNISPSTASCSDVFPVKSKEISRRIQQRRLLAESQRHQTTEYEVPDPVSKHLREPHTKHVEVPQVTAVFQEPEEPYNTQLHPKYPSLGTLIDRGVLIPAKGCLVTESQHGRYVGSLMESGLIRGPGGEVFKTPVQWVSAVNDGVLVKKRRAYREVFYQGKPLLSFVDPCYLPEIDLTKTIDEPVSKRGPDDEVMKSSVCVPKTHTFDLETLLRNCTVRIISDNEIVPSSDLPENFWSAEFSNVRIPKSIQEQIDCW
ncbi:uncharacterized protein LOC117332511 [Pecten maximus]|uniref:uncharacterized protein LOC117332511 n=1 Tax=Pecten maximus TaxID=6579 RepID=UPI0014589831|nr:uncharacterized protein LOC117332511 [Pecten maximus]